MVQMIVLWIVQLSLLSNPDFTVAQDGTGDFRTIQEAIMAVPDFRSAPTVIRIKAGVYKEKIILPNSKTHVWFIGEDAATTVLTYDDHASRLNRFGESLGTSASSSFFIFGNDFYAYNLTFENSAGPVGQAVAVRVSADRAVFEKCRFLGHQDTLYAEGEGTRHYYKECYIEGTTDFIFGAATSVFDNCQIHSKAGGKYITAASTPEKQAHGFIFFQCKLTGDSPVGTVFLGRPWRPFAQTVFIQSDLGPHIASQGWHNWNKPDAEKTVHYAEIENFGPGAVSKERVPWAKTSASKEAAVISLSAVLAGKDGWNPHEFLISQK
ncbi:MAG: pectinesterase family protein [Mongoliitalea sp.]